MNISSCKPVIDTEPENQLFIQNTTQNITKIQDELADTSEYSIKVQSTTFNFDSKKGVFLDSIQLYRCDSDVDYESFFHFYYKGKRYTQEIYFSGIKDHFSFVHMNKDKYLDIVYKNISVSGQGCLSQDIFIFDPIIKKYMRNGYLSAECYLSYNHKYNVYSSYSRGSGQAGPWYYYLFMLQKDTISIFESLNVERIVTCLDSLCNNAEISWNYTHYCNGDTTFYENFDKLMVVEYVWMSGIYDPSKKCQFIKQDQ